MKIASERAQYSIVLVGNFNPAMFQPEWFGKNDIISPEEIDVARNQKIKDSLIVSPQLTLFKTSQLNIRVEQNRFEVIAEKDPLVSIIDFVSKTFNYLGGFDIKAFGFNFSAHYKIGDKETYQRIADNLAPKKFWKTLLKDEVTGIDRKSGLAAIQMQKTKENLNGYYNVILQPSAFVHPGVFMSCNDHSEQQQDNYSAEEAVEIIASSYEDSFAFMKKIQLDVLDEAMKKNG